MPENILTLEYAIYRGISLTTVSESLRAADGLHAFNRDMFLLYLLDLTVDIIGIAFLHCTCT